MACVQVTLQVPDPVSASALLEGPPNKPQQRRKPRQLRSPPTVSRKTRHRPGLSLFLWPHQLCTLATRPSPLLLSSPSPTARHSFPPCLPLLSTRRARLAASQISGPQPAPHLQWVGVQHLSPTRTQPADPACHLPAARPPSPEPGFRNHSQPTGQGPKGREKPRRPSRGQPLTPRSGSRGIRGQACPAQQTALLGRMGQGPSWTTSQWLRRTSPKVFPSPRSSWPSLLPLKLWGSLSHRDHL